MAKREKIIRVCDKCRTDIPATATDRIVVNGHKYQIDLCAKHSSQFHDQLARWLDLGTKTGEPTTIEAYAARNTGAMSPPPAQRQPSPPPAQLAPRLEHTQPRHPRPSDGTAAELPMTAQRWNLTEHAEKRMVERGFDLREVLLAAERPELVTGSQRDPNYEERTRQRCTAVVNPHDLTVVTVTYAQSTYTGPGRPSLQAAAS